MAASFFFVFGEAGGRGTEGEGAVNGRRGRGSEGRIVINVVGIIVGWWFVVGHGEEHGEGAGGLAVKHTTCAGSHHVPLGATATAMHAFIFFYRC